MEDDCETCENLGGPGNECDTCGGSEECEACGRDLFPEIEACTCLGHRSDRVTSGGRTR